MENKFEESISRLEQIVQALENGDIDLDESLKLFEEGIKLTKNCQKMLDDAEKKVSVLRSDKNGKITFVCNDTDDDESKLVEYSADFLIPKIHHAAYPVCIVEDDLKLIEAQQNVA